MHTFMTETEKTIDPNMRALAEEALDLWQNYLDSFSSDPKAKAEAVQMFAPMTKLMQPWTELMQQTMKAAAQKSQTAETAKTHDSDTRQDAPATAAPDASALERRVAELESRLTKLESCMATVMAATTAALRRAP
jgi:hypothetical protein